MLCRRPEKHHPFFVPFAAHEQRTLAQVEVAEIYTYDLAEANAARVHQLEDGAIADALRGVLVRGGDEGRQVLLREDGRETAFSLRCADAGEGVGFEAAFAHEEAEEIAHSAYLAREAGGDDAAIARGGQVAAEGLAIGSERANVFVLHEVASEVEQVGSVIAESVRREILHGDQVAFVRIEESHEGRRLFGLSHGR